ncbi:MAG: hypothetical protein ABJE95_37300 [Byssovorax sp.]
MKACSPGARVVAAILVALAVAAPERACLASVPSEKQAQEVFIAAMKLMGNKQYAEACSLLSRSLDLDPGMGTRFRLAECYEKLGRLASACDQYAAVANAAALAGKPDREAYARKRSAALEPKVAKLTVQLPPALAALPGLEITRDGTPMDKALWGTPVPIDPGDHLVTVRAPGKRPYEGTVWAEPAAKLTIAVAALEGIPDIVAIVSTAKSNVPTFALAGAGGLGIVLGAVFAGLRAGQVSSANALHDKILKARGTCYATGIQKPDPECGALAGAAASGDTLGTGAVVAFTLGGTALLGMAAYLIVPAPKVIQKTPGALRLAPVVTGDHLGLTAWGTF